MSIVNRHRARGFAFVEIIVGLGVFLLFSVGIYSSIQLVFKVVYQSRVRALEAGLANEQIELIRNLPYESVGIVSSTPIGILDRSIQIFRNNISFTVVRTIRNVDDSFDGTEGGNPADASPADYKFIEVSVRCTSCSQEEPLFMTTNVSPKGIEGSGTTGSLVVAVLDSQARPVEGAMVRIVSTSTQPAIDMTDTTDGAGLLKMVALPAGINAYGISVTKSGYTEERTRMPTSGNPNPVKMPLSIYAHEIAQANFIIDRLSSLTIDTMEAACTPLAGIALDLVGSRRIGLNPDALLVDASFSTDGDGRYASSAIPWDAYTLALNGYDLRGVTPGLPISVAPGASETVKIIVGGETARSLLMHVRNQRTLEPISNAAVTVTSTSYTAATTTPTYTTGCTPPGQAYFGGLDEGTYTITISADGYQPVQEIIPVSGHGNVVVDMTTL